MTPERMKKIRRDLGMSQVEFAKLLRIADGRSIRRWEHGERQLGGPVTMLLEMIERDELPMRYYETDPHL